MDEALGALRKEHSELVELPPITSLDRDILALIGAFGTPVALVRERERRESLVVSQRKREDELVVSIGKIKAELQDIRVTVVREAKVVGTTLAQLVLDRALAGRTFDFVIIDEASAALAPYVYAALTKAQVGASIIGDFEQNGPISRTDKDRLDSELVPWLHGHPFALLGINDRRSAETQGGCVALSTQYRFGPLTTALANVLSYGGLLRQGRPREITTPDDAEIILVDTAPLGSAALSERNQVGTGRWWPAGSLLSFELARRHEFKDVGIVAPYKCQAQLIQSRFNDGASEGCVEAAEVHIGTSHAFQGREFETAILDLVEDGSGRSWIARANRNGSSWEKAGALLFNVAVTRNSHRLYIVGNGGAIAAATAGPLHELGNLVRKGDIPVWDAQELLRTGTGAPSSLMGHRRQGIGASPITGASAAAVLIPDLLDESEFYPALLNDLRAAKDQVVIFSPFVGGPFR